MVDNLTKKIYRRWNLISNHINNYDNKSSNAYLRHSRLHSRHTSGNDSAHNQHEDSSQQPTIDDNDVPPLPAIQARKRLFNRKNLESANETDGARETYENLPKHRLHNSHNHEHSIPSRRSIRPLINRSSEQVSTHFTESQKLRHTSSNNNPSSFNSSNNDDRDEVLNSDDGQRNQHIRVSRRAHQPPSKKNHDSLATHSTALIQHFEPVGATLSGRPFKIIFIRHSERANQALGPDWFIKAFRSNVYKPYDPNLPPILPKRSSIQAYALDVPLTVRGLKCAHRTGHSMMDKNLLVDVCLSSTAFRCIQTCEQILAGMQRRDRIPIRIEPGLFECPHFNSKLVDSFMTKAELTENKYNIKHGYKPLIPEVTVPETLDQYFERSANVMRGIVDRYSRHGGTVLIATHAPGILALTDALKGVKPNRETFYRAVSKYSPLVMYIAEHDGSKWKYSNQPFNLIPFG